MEENSKPLQKYLKEYLKQEGLYRVLISQDRSFLSFNKFVSGGWLIGNFLVLGSLILFYKGYDSWALAILFPIISLFLFTILAVIYLVFRMAKSDKKELSEGCAAS